LQHLFCGALYNQWKLKERAVPLTNSLAEFTAPSVTKTKYYIIDTNSCSTNNDNSNDNNNDDNNNSDSDNSTTSTTFDRRKNREWSGRPRRAGQPGRPGINLINLFTTVIYELL
jgi:hypothetical protein